MVTRVAPANFETKDKSNKICKDLNSKNYSTFCSKIKVDLKHEEVPMFVDRETQQGSGVRCHQSNL